MNSCHFTLLGTFVRWILIMKYEVFYWKYSRQMLIQNTMVYTASQWIVLLSYRDIIFVWLKNCKFTDVYFCSCRFATLLCCNLLNFSFRVLISMVLGISYCLSFWLSLYSGCGQIVIFTIFEKNIKILLQLSK